MESYWNFHTDDVRSILTWIITYGKIHYSRYLSAYWTKIISLSDCDTHPPTHDIFVSHKWTVQQQDRYIFSGIPSDQIIEQTCNHDSKTMGRFTGLTESRNAVNR